MHDLLLGLSFIGMLLAPALVAMHASTAPNEPLSAENATARLTR